MKKKMMMACAALLAGLGAIGQIAAWDFYGQSTPASCAATTFSPNLVTANGASAITRGPGAPASAGANSFRTTGFQNNGISTANTDYFQITLEAVTGYKLSLSTIDAKFNGTSTFYGAPGVTSQFAYSLDGTTFTLIGNPVQSTSLTMAQVDLTSISDLQNVYYTTMVTIRYYASGQTPTGGWGFYSSGAGANALTIGGSLASVATLLPVISGLPAGSISTETAILGGHISGQGGSPITGRGTVWSTTSPVGLADHQLAEGGTDTGSFSHTRIGLPPGTKIYHSCYAVNANGTAMATEGMFFTKSVEPPAHVAGFTAMAAGSTAIDLSWTPSGSADGYLILRAEGSTAPTAVPIDAVQYLTGNLLGDAVVAAIVSGGSSSSQSISGLNPGAAYSFTIFPFSWDGTNPETSNYLTAPVVPEATATTVVQGIITYTWIGVVSSDFTHPGNWDPARNFPVQSDILVFNNGITATLVNVPAQTIGQIRILSNTAITLQGSGTVTINGDSGDDLLVDPNCQLNISGSNALSFSLTVAATGSVSGSMTFSGGGHRLLAASANGIIFQAGSSFKTGSGFSGNPFGTVNLNSVVFTAGSKYICQGGGNPFGASAPASVVIFQPGSLYRIDAYAVPSLAGRTYGNFEMNYPGMITVTGTSACSIDNLTASQGWFYINLSGNPGHSIKGNIHVASVATLVFSPSSAGTINLNGSDPQSISGTGAFIAGQNSTFIVSNPSGVNVTADAEMNNVTIDDGAAFNIAPAATVYVAGDLVY